MADFYLAAEVIMEAEKFFETLIRQLLHKIIFWNIDENSFLFICTDPKKEMQYYLNGKRNED